MSPGQAESLSPIVPAYGYLGTRYLLEQEAGRSQTASLYRAVEVDSGQTVAVKVFQRRISADPRFAIRFREYMKAIVEISSPHLVTILDYGVIEGRHYIATEWVDGLDLSAYLAERGALPAAEAAEVASQVCSGLEAVHRGGLLHRNLKPENVLLSSEGLVKVSDSGLSGLLSVSGLTRTHAMMGRVNYIAPEQVRGQVLSPASDLYSLGILLFEMLTARTPFESRDSWEVMRMQVETEPPSPQGLRPGIPAGLAQVVQRLLQKDPADRYPSAAELDAALAPFVTRSFPVPGSRAEQAAAESQPPGRIASLATKCWQFLRAPLPAPLFGRQVSFGLLLLVQLLISFALTFAALYLLTAPTSRGVQAPANPAQSTRGSLLKSRQKPASLKATPSSWQNSRAVAEVLSAGWSEQAFLSASFFYAILPWMPARAFSEDFSP